MKAIQFLDANKIGVCDVERPSVSEGWALIKVSHSGICGTDLNIYAGTHPRAKAPLTMYMNFPAWWRRIVRDFLREQE